MNVYGIIKNVYEYYRVVMVISLALKVGFSLVIVYDVLFQVINSIPAK